MAITVRRVRTDVKDVGTLAEVRESVLAAAKTAHEEGRVIEMSVELDHKIYTLEEPLVFSAKENPELKNVRLTIRSAPDMRPIVRSLKAITTPFDRIEGTDVYVTRLSKGEDGAYPKFRDLYMNLDRMQLSTSPVWRNPFPLLPEERRGEKELEGIYVPYEYAEMLKKEGICGAELKMYVQWEHTTLHIAGVDLTRTREHEGETYALLTFGEDFAARYVRGINGCNNTGNRETFIKNSPLFLSSPGDFAYDASEGLLYVIPPKEIGQCTFYYPLCESLFVFEGMEGVTVEGLTLTGVSSRYIVDNGYKAAQSNNEACARRLETAAIFTKDVRSFTVRDCTFRGIGCNAIQMHGLTATANIYDNRFYDIAMSGIFIGDYSFWPLVSVRDGAPDRVAYYYERLAFDVSIVNNYFEHNGYDYPNCNAIYVSLVDRARILHNSIVDVAFSAISGGWISTPVDFFPGEQFNLRDTEIAYNYFYNYMQVLYDGAAIYVCGNNAATDYAERFNSIHDNYLVLDDPGSRDRRGIYLDASSSNWDVYNNVIETSAFPLFTQYHVPSQYTHHNRSHHLYSTDPIESGNHVPERDTLMSDIFIESDFDLMLKKYPHAAEIVDAAGCTLDTRI